MERTSSNIISGNEKPMIVQYIHSVIRKKLPSVIRDIAVVTIGENEGDKYIAAANQDKNLYILTFDGLEEYQKIEFSQWVRSVTTADLTKNGNSEILVGLGDNTLRLLRFDEETRFFTEICSERFENFVNTCAIADLNGDSNLEIIAGSWDKTLRVFSYKENKNKADIEFENEIENPVENQIENEIENETENQNEIKNEIKNEIENENKPDEKGIFQELWRKELPYAIQSIKVADVLWNNRMEIVVLYKNGGLTVLNSQNGAQIWEFSGEKALLACDVGILDSTGYPYIITGGNDKNLYFLDMYGNVIYKMPVENRITSLLIADVNGNSRNEVLVGIESKFLITFEFPDALLSQIRRRWRYRIHGVINRIITTDFTSDGENEIIFAGYDYAINIIKDLFFGTEILSPIPTAPFHPVPLEEESEEHAALFSTGNDSVITLATDESQAESSAANTDIISTSTGNVTGIGADSSEISRSELIPTIFQDVEYFETKAKLLGAFASGGLDGKQANVFFNDLKAQGIIRYQRTSPRGYYLVSKKIQEKTKIETPIVEKTVEKLKVSHPIKSKELEKSILDKAESILQSEGFFPTKAILFNTLRQNDIPEIEIAPIFDYFKSKMYLSYSRSTPRGYTFISEKGISPIAKIPKEFTVSEELIEKASKIFKDKRYFSSKAKIFDAFSKFDLKDKQAEKLLNTLKERAIVSYSAKKPRGYHYIKGLDIQEFQSLKLPVLEKKIEFEISEDILNRVDEIFKKNPKLASKNAILNKFDAELNLEGEYNSEQLFGILKEKGYLKYSRSAPRGYSFNKKKNEKKI